MMGMSTSDTTSLPSYICLSTGGKSSTRNAATRPCESLSYENGIFDHGTIVHLSGGSATDPSMSTSAINVEQRPLSASTTFRSTNTASASVPRNSACNASASADSSSAAAKAREAAAIASSNLIFRSSDARMRPRASLTNPNMSTRQETKTTPTTAETAMALAPDAGSHKITPPTSRNTIHASE